ncbi:Uncharacterised protein g1013 [Pycnogonum litorale]
MDLQTAKTVIYIYVIPTMSGLGIITNIISMCVLRRKTLHESPYVYLRALSIFNVIFFVVITGLAFIRCGPLCSGHSVSRTYAERIYEYYIYLPHANMAAIAMQFITTAITIERFVSVKRPLQIKSICTREMAKKVIWALVVTSVLINLPRYFMFRPVVIAIPGRLLTHCVHENKTCSLYVPDTYQGEIDSRLIRLELEKIFKSSLRNCSGVIRPPKATIRDTKKKIDDTWLNNATDSPMAFMADINTFEDSQYSFRNYYSSSDTDYGSSNAHLSIQVLGLDLTYRSETESDRGTYEIRHNMGISSKNANKCGWRLEVEELSTEWTNLTWCLLCQKENRIDTDSFDVSFNISKPTDVRIKNILGNRFIDGYTTLIATLYILLMSTSICFNAALLRQIQLANGNLKALTDSTQRIVKMGMYIRAREQQRLTISVLAITMTLLVANACGLPMYSVIARAIFGEDFEDNRTFQWLILVVNIVSVLETCLNLFLYAFFNHKFRRELSAIMRCLTKKIIKAGEVILRQQRCVENGRI